MAQKQYVGPVTISQAFEDGLTGKVKLDPFPWDGQEYEILDIAHMPVKKVRNKDGYVVSELRKKNLFNVKLRGLYVDDSGGATRDGEIELSGSHELTQVNRGKVSVTTNQDNENNTDPEDPQEPASAQDNNKDPESDVTNENPDPEPQTAREKAAARKGDK